MLIRTIIATASLLVFVASAKADIIVDFDQASYSGTIGSSVDVTLRLTVNGAHASLLQGNGAGLYSLGSRLSWDNTPVATATTVLPGVDFDGGFVIDNGTLGEVGLVGFSGDVTDGINSGSSTITFAKVTFQLNTAGTSNLSLADFLAASDDTTDVSTPTIYDSIIDFTSSATITAVPEPASLLMLGTGGIIALTVRRFRRRV